MSDRSKHWRMFKHHHPIIGALVLIALGFYAGRQNADITTQDVVDTIGKTLEATGEILIDAGDALKGPVAPKVNDEIVEDTGLSQEALVTVETPEVSETTKIARTSGVDTQNNGSVVLLGKGDSITADTIHQTNQACIDIIKAFQEVRLEAYAAPSGAVLIGFGHAKTTTLGMTIDAEEADMLLRRDLRAIEQEVSDLLTLRVNENEFSAMVCLAHNIGKSAFSESTVLNETNVGNTQKAAAAFLIWNKARIDGVVQELEALNQRRQAERSLYLG
jgi:lysozyme